MKTVIKHLTLLMITISLVGFEISHCSAQWTTTLLTESFESGTGTTPPAGWAIEQVTGTVPGIDFVANSANPAVSAAFNGTKFVRYNSYNITSGSTRLKCTTALSTLNRNFILVDFNWFEDPSNSTSNDKVEVQWSVDGTTWNTAGSFYRYNVVPGWKLKHQWLPAGANNQPALYVAFLFASANGGNCSLDWMHVTGSSTANGVVSGYVRDASTQMPVKWAVVSAGINRDTTTSDGFYAIYNLYAGATAMTVAAPCYISGSATVIIATGTIAIRDFNLISAPVVTGMVTDGCSGAPVAGALVTVAGSYQTMTGLDGTYLLSCVPVLGNQPFMVSKTGYDSFTSMVTLVVNTTTTVNANLLCTPVPPGNVSAVLNDPLNPTAVNISWTAPLGNYQLTYDDGSQEGYSVWATAGNLHALKFTPLGWPALVTGGVVNVGISGNYPPGALPLGQFIMFVCKADGPGGVPGTIIDSVFLTPTNYGWNNFSFATPVSVTSGDFFLVMKQGGIPPHTCGIAIDTNASQFRSWSKFATGGGSWVPVDGNYMMRATMNGPGGPVMLDNTTVNPSYQVWRLLQGNETNQAAWTSVYTGNATTTIDNNWPSLPCGPYLWAAKAIYPPGQRPSVPTFSNVIGKCWTSTVTVQANSACEVCGRNTVVSLTNINYPDTNYLIPLDSFGHGGLQGIWKGNYRLYYSQFGCQTVIQNNIPILGDTTLTFAISEATPPVTDLSVNNLSLLTTWNFPYLSYTLFSENWSSGSFSTNQWVTSGGNNWQISNAIGNPAPSAMFNWTPQCTNYSQYLTSKVLNTGNSPQVLLQYDVYLDDYSTTSMNTLSVEIWNGVTWSVARIYDNQGGSIPWTTEMVDISNSVSGDFKLRFNASGTDTYGINNWNIDNIKITGRDSGYSPAACLLGYSVGINNVLSAFTTDTSYYIPPDQVIYGQPYQFCVTASYSGGYSTQVCQSFISQFLYPPDSLTVTPTECTAYIAWKKPDDPVAQSGLIGYNIFRNGSFIHSNDHPDSLNWYDLNLNPGNYLYGVTARYDLGVYGFPGQPGESLRLNDSVADTVHCGFPVPFNESWNQGNFNFHNWTFQPEQGNWGIGNGLKTTDPCADFHGLPMRTNYSYTLVSDNIDAFAWKCAGLWLDFDFKLVDRNATGNEKMLIEAWYDDDWHLLSTLSNNGSVDWTAIHLDLSAVSGKGFRIRFVAQGINSADILHWYIDNIKVYGICLSPTGLAYSTNGFQVDFTWSAPECAGMAEPTGYNVYRTDATGLPPFLLRNPSLVPGNTYSDNIGPVSGGIYSYYVTAIFDDPMMPEPLCESLASDTVVVSTVGIPGKSVKGISVYPNPANNTIQIKSDQIMVLVQILDYKGKTFNTLMNPESVPLAIDVSGYPSGIYFFRVTDQLVTKTVKVVIVH